MRTFRRTKYPLVIAVCILSSLFGYVFASEKASSTLESFYGDSEFISLASGYRQPLRQAPAVATVITADDIAAMGADDLDQVLESVPGLHVSYSPVLNNPIYSIRGIASGTNPHVLMMVNGIPITDVVFGSRGFVWGGYPVRMISRIEVIRGPGSALYGADAFAGTINIITKNTSDIGSSLELGASAASFQTRRAWLIAGHQGSDWGLTFSMQTASTEGHRSVVRSDFQTLLDDLSGTSASLAPGAIRVGYNGVDTRLDFNYRDWRLRLGYQARRDVGHGAGVSQALDQAGSSNADRATVDLSYTALEFIREVDAEFQLSYYGASSRSEAQLLPPNTAGFSEGLLGEPDTYQDRYRANAGFTLRRWANHRVKVGLGAELSELSRVLEKRNFLNGATVNDPPTPLAGGLQTLQSADTFIPLSDRTLLYLYLQDEWLFANDWRLTGGVRYDKYSDFGSTVNPRAALVWDASHSTTIKLLYGRAFRAPSFAELNNRNNPVAIGNPNLKPERIDSGEVALEYRPSRDWGLSINLYRYRIRDLISFSRDPSRLLDLAENRGRRVGYGMEWQVDWAPRNNVEFVLNQAWQRNEDPRTGVDDRFSPRMQTYMRMDWEFIQDWHYGLQTNWVTGRGRDAGDNRPDTPSYISVDMFFRALELRPGLEFRWGVRNLFDADIREPSPAPGAIVDDLPQAPRSFHVSVSKKW